MFVVFSSFPLFPSPFGLRDVVIVVVLLLLLLLLFFLSLYSSCAYLFELKM
jgi:hypothetical protein